MKAYEFEMYFGYSKYTYNEGFELSVEQNKVTIKGDDAFRAVLKEGEEVILFVGDMQMNLTVVEFNKYEMVFVLNK